MAKPQLLGNVLTVRNRQHTSSCHYSIAVNDDCAVMKGAILEKKVLNQHTVKVGINTLSRLNVIAQMLITLNDNQSSDLAVRHILAGTNQREPILILQITKATA